MLNQLSHDKSYASHLLYAMQIGYEPGNFIASRCLPLGSSILFTTVCICVSTFQRLKQPCWYTIKAILCLVHVKHYHVHIPYRSSRAFLSGTGEAYLSRVPRALSLKQASHHSFNWLNLLSSETVFRDHRLCGHAANNSFNHHSTLLPPFLAIHSSNEYFHSRLTYWIIPILSFTLPVPEKYIFLVHYLQSPFLHSSETFHFAFSEFPAIRIHTPCHSFTLYN